MILLLVKSLKATSLPRTFKTIRKYNLLYLLLLPTLFSLSLVNDVSSALFLSFASGISHLSVPRGLDARVARSQLSRAEMSSGQYRHTIPTTSVVQFYVQILYSSVTSNKWQRVPKWVKAITEYNKTKKIPKNPPPWYPLHLGRRVRKIH